MIRAADISKGRTSASCRTAGSTWKVVHQAIRHAATPQKNHADHKADQKDGRGGQRCEIDQAILPQLTSYRPVEGLGGRDWPGSACLRFERRIGHGVDWVFIWPLLVPGRPASPARQETNRQCRVCALHQARRVETINDVRSNSRMLRPNTSLTIIGLSARAASTCSGCTVTST